MKKTLLQKLGLLGVVSLLSYTAAVVFSPLAYPGYNPMAQAVSDLSAANAPSLSLWNSLRAFYNVCEAVFSRPFSPGRVTFVISPMRFSRRSGRQYLQRISRGGWKRQRASAALLILPR